jgi:UDP-glucose 4-epimerase
MNVLITGGSGFIGSHIVEHYQGIADEIRVLDNLRTGYKRNLQGLKCRFIEGSITDRDLVNRAVQGVDYVFHLAALVSVPESMAKPAECVDINVKGLLNVLEASAQAGVKKLVFASSAAIYGDNPTVPKVESMLPGPKSPYAITKLDGEYYLGMFTGEGRLETAAIRFFNVFGPRQDPKGAYAAAVPIFIESAARNGPITVFGDGEQTRDFIYVKDIVGALTFAAQTPGVTGVFNAGYGGQITINQLAREIINAAGSTSEVIHGPARAGDVKHSRASAAKLRSAGWTPQHTLQEGLAVTLGFFKTAAVCANSAPQGSAPAAWADPI